MSLSQKLAKKNLRSVLKEQRAAISNAKRMRYAHLSCKDLLRSPLFTQSKRIAFYWPHQDEFNVLPCLYAAINQGKTLLSSCHRKKQAAQL